MRIGTWNLERGKSLQVAASQREVLDAHGADIYVITESPVSLSVPGPGVVTSVPQLEGPRGPEVWVSIIGGNVGPLEIPRGFGKLSTAAQANVGDRHVVVYGSVLPWLQAATQAPELLDHVGESSAEMFARYLSAQVEDVRALCDAYRGSLIVWAGDFNQTLVGPNYGGSRTNRKLLREALDDLGFEAWNAGSAHAKPGMCAIDLLCGPKDHPVRGIHRIPPTDDNERRLSDHAGYVVEL